jgi:hypothetical protein
MKKKTDSIRLISRNFGVCKSLLNPMINLIILPNQCSLPHCKEILLNGYLRLFLKRISRLAPLEIILSTIGLKQSRQKTG